MRPGNRLGATPARRSSFSSSLFCVYADDLAGEPLAFGVGMEVYRWLKKHKSVDDDKIIAKIADILKNDGVIAYKSMGGYNFMADPPQSLLTSSASTYIFLIFFLLSHLFRLAIYISIIIYITDVNSYSL